MLKFISFIAFLAFYSRGAWSVDVPIISSPQCNQTSCINDIMSQYNENESVAFKVCGTFDFNESILLRSNRSLIGCDDNLFQIPEGFEPKSKGYENAVIKFDKRGASELSSITFSNISIQNINIAGIASTNTLDSRVMGIVLTPMGADNNSFFYANNITLKGNTIVNLDSNGIVVGNPNRAYFHDNFLFQDVYVESNTIKDLEKSGAGILIVDETIPELRYDELGYLGKFRIDRVHVHNNIVNNVYYNSDERLHGAGFGIIVDGAKYVKVSSNLVEKYAEEGIRIYDSNWVDIYENQVEPAYRLIEGNAFNANGIKFNRVANAKIYSNKITDSSGPAIELYGTAKVDVFDNVAFQEISHGIRIESYRVLDNPRCYDNPHEKDGCLFRNRWINIYDNTINYKCGCRINPASNISVYDGVEIYWKGEYRNLGGIGSQDLREVMSCKVCD